MNTALLTVWGLTITPWKIVGYSGTILFSLRWVVQVLASRRAGRPSLPRLFWYMSILGSLCLLLYFLFAKNDGPGILNACFPLLMACYNLFLDFRNPQHPVPPTIGGPGETPAEVI
jgi:lipid-A-disaccharide synthase-like uncharacterized protein